MRDGDEMATGSVPELSVTFPVAGTVLILMMRHDIIVLMLPASQPGQAATDVIIGTMYNGNRLNRRIITSTSTGREISMGAKNLEQILCLKCFFRVFTNRQEPIYVSFNYTFELSVTTIFISTCKNFISKIFESFVEINQNQQECLH